MILVSRCANVVVVPRIPALCRGAHFWHDDGGGGGGGGALISCELLLVHFHYVDRITAAPARKNRFLPGYFLLRVIAGFLLRFETSFFVRPRRKYHVSLLFPK